MKLRISMMIPGALCAGHCQSPLPDAAANGKIWSDTKEVFFQP
jgi:hypothetical protein